MTPIFKKLNLGSCTKLAILNSPESFRSELQQLQGVTLLEKVTSKSRVSFVMAFAITQAELDKLSKQIVQLAEGDAVVWVAYPKASSKRYSCEFNRDTGWRVLGDAGFEPVRQVAIDADWSALRFRRVEFIKSLKRSDQMAISAEGKKRTKA